ncbi:MAG: alkaline phosphatase family protein [Acidobacteriaceae bacterium]
MTNLKVPIFNATQTISAFLLLGLLLLFAPLLKAAQKPHVLMISIDGMRPDYVTAAQAHHLHLPTLQSFLKDGTYAEGVTGVLPTVTYPSHTTLVTGAWPSQHGIFANGKFDPLHNKRHDSYWYASDINVPTLWEAASAAGLTVGNVGWPVTVGAKGIDYSLPAVPPYEVRSADDEPHFLNQPYDHPAGLRKQLDATLPANMPPGYEKRFYWGLAVIERYHPDLMLVHLARLDHVEHMTGPFSAESDRTIEAIDSEVAQLIAAERAVDPNSIIVIVSDHGFSPLHTRVNLGVLFVRAGLIQLRATQAGSQRTDIASWQAQLWPTGGTTAILLRDPSDSAVRDKVKAILKKAAANPDYGIEQVLTRAQTLQQGGFADPRMIFVVAWKPGYAGGGALTGPVVVSGLKAGTHGYLAHHPELHSSFFMEGKGIAKGNNLGEIDMRQIAPTVAKLLGVKLIGAKLPPVRYAGRP